MIFGRDYLEPPGFQFTPQDWDPLACGGPQYSFAQNLSFNLPLINF